MIFVLIITGRSELRYNIHVFLVMSVFVERAIAEMIKELKQLYEGSIPEKPEVIPLYPDKLTYAERKQALEAVNIIKGKNKLYHQWKNLRKWGQEKDISGKGRKCATTNGFARGRGFIHHDCDQYIRRERSSYF